MSARELIDEHGSPLWLADVDRFAVNLRAFEAVWKRHWLRTRIAYSYKTNRLLPLLHAAEAGAASPEVVCGAEFELAAVVVEADPRKIILDGPAKPDWLLARAGTLGALVIIDSEEELERAADAGVARVGLRVALDSFTGAPTRFGIPPDQIVAAARSAARCGLSVQALSTHLVSTDFEPATDRIVVSWPREPGEHARAAALLAQLAAELAAVSVEIGEIDLGGGLPPARAVEDHAREVAAALRARGFAGGLVLEPGRALVADAVDLAFSVVAVKSLADGTRCLVCDAGTNFLPGAVYSPPRIEAPEITGTLAPTLVTGPLCLNVDVVHPDAQLPEVMPGALLVARDVGAYQQVASTEFGEPLPAVAVRRHGRWSLHGRAHRNQLEHQAV